MIDGQSLRYRNAVPEWISMVWPNPAGTPGVRINAVTDDGQSIEILSEPGTSGLQRMLEGAARKKLDDGTTLLTWTKGAHRVNAIFRLVCTPAPIDGRASAGGGDAVVPAVGGVQRFTGLALPTLVAGPESAVKPASVASSKAPAAGAAARP